MGAHKPGEAGVNQWDDTTSLSPAVILEVDKAIKMLMPMASRGARIRRVGRTVGIRVTVDASREGYGIRVQGEERSLQWTDLSKEYSAACSWMGDAWGEQNHRELAAVLELLRREPEVMRGREVLLLSDNKTVVSCMNTGSCPKSDILSRMMQLIWEQAVTLECSIRCEHLRENASLSSFSTSGTSNASATSATINHEGW